MQTTRHSSLTSLFSASAAAAGTRRRGGLLPVATVLIALIGCAGPAIRSQSPEVAALIGMESDIRLVGDYAAPWGTHPLRIERAALVTGLPGTGSDPPPGTQRALLMADMQARGVAEPNKLLASPTTALVWVHGYLPPGIRKGDRFDVMVEVPADNDTTSLSGGWLMPTRLAEMAILGQRVRDGHVLGDAEGPLLVDPVSGGTLDSKSKIRARVPGGGVSRTTRQIGLIIAPEHRSIALSKRVGDTINRRFHAVIKGTKRGVATPKTERFLDLDIAPAYEHNLPRYIRVIRAIAVVEPPAGRHARMELLSRQLADPVTAPSAALKLEAIGRDALPVLKQGLESSDAEVRFAAAEALAYLGESTAATHLAEAALHLRSARPAALAALQVLDDANGIAPHTPQCRDPLRRVPRSLEDRSHRSADPRRPPRRCLLDPLSRRRRPAVGPLHAEHAAGDRLVRNRARDRFRPPRRGGELDRCRRRRGQGHHQPLRGGRA